MLLWSHQGQSSRTETRSLDSFFSGFFSISHFDSKLIWMGLMLCTLTHTHTYALAYIHSWFFRDTDVLYISSSFKDWLTQPQKKRKRKEEKRTEWRSRCSFNITVYLMQHLQSLKTEEWEQGDECKDGRMKEWRWKNGPVISFLKGHKSLLHTVTTRRWWRSLITSLSEECDRTLNHNWVYSEPEKMAGGGSEGGGGEGLTKEKENQSDCPFSPPTSRNGFVIPQLPSLHCHTLKYIFKFILNLIHLFLRPLSCSNSAGYGTTHGR